MTVKLLQPPPVSLSSPVSSPESDGDEPKSGDVSDAADRSQSISQDNDDATTSLDEQASPEVSPDAEDTDTSPTNLDGPSDIAGFVLITDFINL